MKGLNLVGLQVNLSRVYEIIRVGGHSVTMVYNSNPEDPEGRVNPKDIKHLADFYEMIPVKDGDIIVEMTRPSWDDIKGAMGGRYETRGDIDARIKKARDFPRPSFDTANEAGISLLGVAYDRMNFSLTDVIIIREVGCTIAQVAHSNVVRVEHIAEAIQYRAVLDEPHVKIYEN